MKPDETMNWWKKEIQNLKKINPTSLGYYGTSTPTSKLSTDF